MPTPTPPEVNWRPAEPGEIPGGAQTVANSARKNGWEVRIGYACGPWVADDDDDPAEEIKTVEIVSVQGRKGSKQFYANWHRKLWTKPGQEGKYTFAGAQMKPPIEGAVATTKAKKDRHPESLGDATIGGLKNSKTLNTYLKEN